MNEEISAREVRLIGAGGEQLGITAFEEARMRALEAGLDLVEIAPNAAPPVCRLMDYGKYRYAQAKRAREAKKKQKKVHLKEIKLRPKIEPHDYATKLNHVVRFLKEGDKVKVMVMFRGRELTHAELGRRVLDRVVSDTKEIAQVERPPVLEGRFLSLTLLPTGVSA